MNAPERFFLPDTQAMPDVRQMAIQRVGVKGLRYPIALRNAAGEVQHTVATFAMYVGLPHDVKGTHMSRFVEVLESLDAPLWTSRSARALGVDARRLEANSRSPDARAFRTSSARQPRCPAWRACWTIRRSWRSTRPLTDTPG